MKLRVTNKQDNVIPIKVKTRKRIKYQRNFWFIIAILESIYIFNNLL